MKHHRVGYLLVIVLCMMSVARAGVLQAGGNRLMVTQNRDGGWDWPLWDGDFKLSNCPHILAPTGMGLTFCQTSDPNCVAALRSAGNFLLSKQPQDFTPEDGYFAVSLDRILGGTRHTDFVKKNFYELLAKGTFPYFGSGALMINTGWYIQIIRQQRAADGMPNLAAFDCGIGLYAAHLVGADTEAWLAGTKAEVEELDPAEVYDVLGLAGAVLGLAAVHETWAPTKGACAGAKNVADLAEILAGYQLSTGGLTWNSLCLQEGVGNETTQETAFALLALKEADRTRHLDRIRRASEYLKRSQLSTGGWEDSPGMGEYNQLTGEALWAIGEAEKISSEGLQSDSPPSAP